MQQDDAEWQQMLSSNKARAFSAVLAGSIVLAGGAMFLAQAGHQDGRTAVTDIAGDVTPTNEAEAINGTATKTDAGEKPTPVSLPVQPTGLDRAAPKTKLQEHSTNTARPINPAEQQQQQQQQLAASASSDTAKSTDDFFAPRLKPTHPRLNSEPKAFVQTAQITHAKHLNTPSPDNIPVGTRATKRTSHLDVSDDAATTSSYLITADLAGQTSAPLSAQPKPAIFVEAAPKSLALAYTEDLPGEPRSVAVRLKKGETFVDALRRAGIRAADRNAATYALGKHVNLRRLKPQQEFALIVSEPNQTLFQHASADDGDNAFLLSLTARKDRKNRISITRNQTVDGDNFDVAEQEIEITTRIARINGQINGSLFLSAQKQGAPNKIVAELANMFAYDIDFQRDIFGGDEFEAVYEIHYDDEGNIIGSGDILFGRLNWRGRKKEKSYYRFANSGTDYFDRAGQSAKRLLMKTPIDGARLSSGFGTRKHPVLGYRKAHKGIDFAARSGTPIYAAGDGVIERANRYGSFGNYVKIRHSNGYKTAYAHLKGFKKGIRAGKRVRQGDIIGYVGTTGRSTGPHLHYEVHLNGKAVNPQRLKIATGTKLKADKLANFEKVRDEIDALRAPEPQKRERLAQNTSGEKL